MVTGKLQKIMDNEQDILIACSVGDLFWLKKSLLGRKKTVNKIVNSEGYTPLHLAAYQRNLPVLEHLIVHCKSLDVNVSTYKTGDTPLHLILSNHASSDNSNILECVQLLLEKKAHCNKQNMKGQTALHLAAELGCIAVMRTLLSYGADFTIKDQRNLTPLDLACLHGNHECARLLKALHWAKNKDCVAEHRIWKNRQCQKQKAVIKIVQTKLRQQEAEIAYEEWLKQNQFSTSPILLPKPSRTTCETCSKQMSLASKTTCASNTESYPRVAKIQLCFDQAQHNLESVGKPEKLYPYVNYPPAQYRHHAATKKGPKSRPHSSMSCRQSPRLLQSRSKSAPAKRSSSATSSTFHELQISKINHDTKVTPSVGIISSEEKGVITPKHIEALKQESDEGEEEGSTSSIDGLTFHEVGPENDLRSLVSPTGAPSFDPTDLLKVLSESSSSHKSFRKSHSYYRPSQHEFYKRKLSLIPEGEIVTDYDNTDNKDSQLLLDEEFLCNLMPFAFSNGSFQGVTDLEKSSEFMSNDSVSVKVAWDEETNVDTQQEKTSNVCLQNASFSTKLRAKCNNSVLLKTSVFEFGGKVSYTCSSSRKN